MYALPTSRAQGGTVKTVDDTYTIVQDQYELFHLEDATMPKT